MGEGLSNLALKAVHYLEKIEAGPKTVIIGFHNRAFHPAEFYGVWRYLESCGRLHLLRNFAHLLTSRSNRKYLPVIYERKIIDPTIPIWECDFEDIADQHILRLFTEQIEEGQHLDYKREDSLTDKKARKGLLKDFCAMANSGGGVLLIGIKESRITKDRQVRKTHREPDAGTEHRIREAGAASQNAVARSHEKEHRRGQNLSQCHRSGSAKGRRSWPGEISLPTRINDRLA